MILPDHIEGRVLYMDKKRLIVYILVCSLLTGITVYGVVMLVTDKRPVLPDRKAAEKDRRDKTDVFLYFGAETDTFLVAENRTVNGAAEPVTLSKNIINELITGPSGKNLVRTLPPETVCRAFYLTDRGVAYADFSAGIKDRHPGGSQAELLTIYSIVNSLVLNVDEIKKVKILIEGSETDTLAGHIDLRRPFEANMRMIR